MYRLHRGKLVTYVDRRGNRQAPLPATLGSQLRKAVKFDMSRTGHYREWQSHLNRFEQANPMATIPATTSPQFRKGMDAGYD
jgi:hypothetical protein